MPDLVARPHRDMGSPGKPRQRDDHSLPARKAPWKVTQPGEGWAKITAQERHVEEEKHRRAEARLAQDARKPPLDLTFGVGGAASGTGTGGAGERSMSAGGTARRGRSLIGTETLRSTGRSTIKPPVPSATISPQALTSRALPAELLATLTPTQLRKPRHPAHLLDSSVHHDKHWSKLEKRECNRAFSVPSRMRPPTLTEQHAAARFVQPDKNWYNPRNEQKAAWYNTDRAPYALFSTMPQDAVWLAKEKARRAAELEARFYAATSQGGDVVGEEGVLGQGGYEGEDAFQQEQVAPPVDFVPGSTGRIDPVGTPALVFQSLSTYTARRSEVLSTLRPPVLGAKLLDQERAKVQARLDKLAARVNNSARQS